MFKYSPRLRTVYIDLKVTDIINLNFRKLIHIDGTYWILNRIVDYMLHKNQPTKVELAEWVELGGTLPTTTNIGGGVHGGLYDESRQAVPDNNPLNNNNQGI